MAVPPSPEVAKAVEDLRQQGNALYNKGKWSAAKDRYTEALTLNPEVAVLYVNRAMCHKKLGDLVGAAAHDAERALELDRDNMKAHFLLGSAKCEQGQWLAATAHLQKALEAAREKGDAIKDEIWRQLALAKHSLWVAQAGERAEERRRLRALAQGLLQRLGSKEAEELVVGVRGLLDAAGRADECWEVPGALVCPLTMEVFRDPVITPAGHSYERAALLEHLSKVGKWDPVARNVPVYERDLVSNLGLRASVMVYLEEHPWAWAECR